EAGGLRADLLKAIDNRLAHIVGVEKRICHCDVLGNTESRPWIEAQPNIPNDLRHIRHRDQQRRLEICRHDRRYLSYLARTARFPPDHLTPLPQSGWSLSSRASNQTPVISSFTPHHRPKAVAEYNGPLHPPD